MAGPPKDIPASLLWAKLSSAERPYKLVDFPRYDEDGQPVGQVAIRILTQEERMVCAAAAEDVTRKHIKEGKRDEIGYERLYADAFYVEVLYRCCRDPEDRSKHAFPTPEQLRKALTTDECAMLFEHYMTVQLELGPIGIGKTMSDEECEAWIDRLVEGGSAFPFDLLGSDTQKIVLLYMAYQLRSAPRDNSSASPQLEEPSPE